MKILDIIKTYGSLIQTIVLVIALVVIYNQLITTKKVVEKQREELIMVKENLAVMYTYNKGELGKAEIRDQELKKQYDSLKGKFDLIAVNVATIKTLVQNIPTDASSTSDTLTFTKGDYFKLTSKYRLEKTNAGDFFAIPYDSEIEKMELKFNVESNWYEDKNQGGQYVVTLKAEETNFKGLVKIEDMKTTVSIPHKKPLKYIFGVGYQSNGFNFIGGARVFGFSLFKKEFNVLGTVSIGKDYPISSANLMIQF